MFRADLRPGPLESAGPTPRPIHRAMMIKGLLVTAFVLTAFLMGKDPALVAAVAAAALLITRRVNPQKIYRQIDWDLLVLFIGLFVVIGGVEQVGLAQRLFDLLAPIGLHTVAGLSVVTAIVSNVISNVPAVMLLSRLVPQLPESRHLVADARHGEHARRQPDARRVDRQPHRPRRRAAARRGDYVLAVLQRRRAGHGADAALRMWWLG